MSPSASARAIDHGFLQDICNATVRQLPKMIVSFMDTRGSIVASSARERIGDIHEGAARIMEGEIDLLEVTAQDAATSAGMREGVAQVVYLGGERVLCLGLGGPIEIARDYSEILREWVLSVLQARQDEERRNEQVAQAERQFREILDLSPAGAFAVDDDGKLVFSNLQFRRMLGYSPTEYDGIDTRRFWFDLVQREEIVEQLRAKGGQRLNVEVVWKTKNGDPLHALLSYTQVAYQGGQLSIAGGSRMAWLYDITDLKRAEQARLEVEERGLREERLRHERAALAEQQFREILDLSPAGLLVVDEEGRLVFYNQQLRKMLGYEDDEFDGIDTRLLWFDLDQRAEIIEKLKEQGGQHINEEVIWKTKQGEPLHALLSYTQSAYRGGEVNFAGGSRLAWLYDISELKRAEEARRLTEKSLALVNDRLDLALSMESIGIWDVNLASNEVWWSDRYASMLGEDPATFKPTMSSWEAHLHPRSAKRIMRRVDRFLKSDEKTLRIRRHVITRDDRELWTESLMHLQRDPTGQPVRLTGIDVDITEQYQKEQEAKAATIEISMKNQELEMLSTKLSKYLSPQIYSSIFSGEQDVKIESERKKLSVFFSDIVGFTETTDRLESEELTQLLNHYLTEMSRVALDHGATIDKYVGDAILIFFGDPETRGVKEDALACVRMAIAMQRRMSELEGHWRSMGIERPLKCRAGINTAYCTVGNFGSEDRLDYTIIGGGVNLAARLESAAEPGSILISYETFALVRDEIYCEEREQITVKGIAYPVSTYEVIDEHRNLVQRSERIKRDDPYVKLDVNVAALSSEERQEAANLLRGVISQLENKPS